MRTIASALNLLLIAGCGGGEKKVERPAASDDDAESGGAGEVLVPEEKFDEIKRVFERKASMVGRCYFEGEGQGETDGAGAEADDKDPPVRRGFVTVAVTVSTTGAASSVTVLKTNFPNQAVGDCVADMVRGWTFTDSLPRPVETSHTYVLDKT